MADAPREAWITGIGIVSSLGEGADAHWEKLSAPPASANLETFAPYIVHPLAALDLDKQIPKKDQRQMEPWQRIGTYAAGLALESAGLKGNAEILSRMDMIVAAGGGERDIATDSAILTALPKAEKPDAFINERMMGDLRPTLFLAQLSNLMAGNISIVHGVTGSSRTFMGEEAAGVDAARIALARIAAGQSDIALFGGAHNAEREELLMLYEFGGFNLKDQFAPVWERGPNGGFALGSHGAFIVLEAREHAQKRGATPLAKLTTIVSDRGNGKPGAVTEGLARMWQQLPPVNDASAAMVSGASGAEPVTAEERAFMAQHPALPVRATGTHIGHGLEAQFPFNLALAAVAVSRGKLFAPAGGSERQMDNALTQAVVTGVGHWRGLGLALVEKA